MPTGRWTRWPARSPRTEAGRLLRALRPLLLLLHPLYLYPHQVSRFPQHLYRVALLREMDLQQVLHLPDTCQGARQPLLGAHLLLLLLLLLLLGLLLLTALCHWNLLSGNSLVHVTLQAH